MLICNRCGTSIPDGARFCPACADPVTKGDLAKNQVVPRSEHVELVCPRCEETSRYTVPASGVVQLTCSACSRPFDTRVVCVRSKRSSRPKNEEVRSFSVRVETLDGRDDLVEFDGPSRDDFEVRSRDMAAFSSIKGRLTVVQNLNLGRHLSLATPGCTGVILLWLGIAAAGAIVF